MIIDCHTHIGHFKDLHTTYTKYELISNMDRFAIAQSIVAPDLDGNCTEKNQDIRDQTDDRFKQWYWVKDGGVSLHESELCNAFGFKLHPSLSEIMPQDEALDHIWGYAADNDMPVSIHCARNKYADPSNVFEAAIKYPGVNFIAAHMGGSSYDMLIKALQHPKAMRKNVYFETSNLRHPEMLRKFIDRFGIKHILFGSDWPFCDLRVLFAVIDFAGLTYIEREKLFHENIKRLGDIG